MSVGQFTTTSVVIFCFGLSALGGVDFEKVKSNPEGRGNIRWYLFLYMCSVTQETWVAKVRQRYYFHSEGPWDARFREPGWISDARKHPLAVALFSNKAC